MKCRHMESWAAMKLDFRHCHDAKKYVLEFSARTQLNGHREFLAKLFLVESLFQFLYNASSKCLRQWNVAYNASIGLSYKLYVI